MQGAVASPPGDAAGWFWSVDCVEGCSRVIPGGDFAFAPGRVDSPRPFTLGGGVNGVFPYVEGYVQLRRAPRNPAGVGARIGVPILRRWWHEHQLYARVDVPVGSDGVLLWNPGLVLHTGRSPNGENPGTFIGVVQAVGLQTGSGPSFLVPSAGVVLGRSQRRTHGERIGPETKVFGFASVSVRFSRRD